MTDEQIAALTFYERSPLFDEKEKAVIQFADRVTRAPATMRDADLEALGKWFKEDEIVEMALVVAVANFTNRMNDALKAEPDLG